MDVNVVLTAYAGRGAFPATHRSWNVCAQLIIRLATRIVGRGLENPRALADWYAIKVVHKPAALERRGINPFTKEETIFKAKPA